MIHIDNLFEQFKNREIKAKDIFYIKSISKKEAGFLIKKYHYLGYKGFMFSFAYGLFIKSTNEIIGAAVFGRPSFPTTIKGWVGYDERMVVELHRLVLVPKYNECNCTSFLLGNSLKEVKKKEYKMVISLADSSHHIGYIYQACNFKYYGLTNSKTDFFAEDGRTNPKCSTKELRGVWLPRTRKHRYAYLFDKKLEIKYEEKSYPKTNDRIKLECCNGTKKVHDNRFDITYTCPRCCDELKIIPKPHNDLEIIWDNIHNGYIISIDEDKIYSDEEMALFLNIDEIDYMNITSLNGSIKYEDVIDGINKVFSIFKDIDDVKKAIDDLMTKN